MINITPPLIKPVSNNTESNPADNTACYNCDFFISKDNKEYIEENMYGDIDADICSLHHRVLSNNDPEKITKSLQKEIANNCKDYLNSGSNSKKYDYSYINIGNTQNISATGGDEKVMSCHNCTNFVSMESNNGDVDINTTLPICKAKGIAIIPGYGRKLATDCNFASYGGDTKTFNNTFRIDVLSDLIPPDIIETETHSIPDPLEYVTDAIVTDSDSVQGIRAWRKIYSNPKDENSQHLLAPIFDRNSFTPEEQSKIPRPGDQEHIDLYIDHLNLFYKFIAIWKMEGTPCLTGFAGVGKTEAYRYIAYMMQAPFERVSITNSTEIDDLAGRHHFSNEKGTYFEMGRIPKAWNKRCVMVIDEPNVGPPDVWQFIRPLTDNSKQLVLDMNKGERISRHDHCYFGMAMNPAWDMRNVGTHEIGDADGRRLMHIFVSGPDENTEKKIIVDRCNTDGYNIDNKTLSSIMKISKDLKDLCENDTLPIQWGVAQQIKVARATRYFPLVECYRMAVADFLDPDSQEQIIAAVKIHTTTTERVINKKSRR